MIKKSKTQKISKFEEEFEPMDYSSYIDVYYMGEGSYLPAAMRHEDLAELLEVDMWQLRQVLLSFEPKVFRLYCYVRPTPRSEMAWHLYRETFPLEECNDTFVAITKDNIEKVKLLFQNDERRLKIIDDIAKSFQIFQ